LILVTADHETGGLKVVKNNGAGVIPTVSWSTSGHTAGNVPVYGWGAGAEGVSGIMENTDIFRIMMKAATRHGIFDGLAPRSGVETPKEYFILYAICRFVCRTQVSVNRRGH
jgi:hypothetical protein